MAREAGVSRTTVSHALNDKGYVDIVTRERVKAVARALSYRPNVRAQRLRSGEAHTIALLSSMPFEIAGGASRLGFLMEVAAVAAGAALERGLALILVPPVTGERLALEQLDIDGAIVIEPAVGDANLRHLQERALPVVCIGRYDDSAAVPYVDLQSSATTTLLLDHLRVQGARQIALIIGEEPRNSYRETEATYRAFCKAYRMRPRIATASEAKGEQGGYDACTALLEKFPEVDALCVPVDAFAVGSVRAIQERGLKIPADIKVVTRYDGVRARACNPPLTAVDLHLEVISSLAVDLLFAHLGGKHGAMETQAPPPRLIARISSG